MSRLSQSRFIFEMTENTRTFRHQRKINNQIINCPTCHSLVGANEPYSHHWLGNQDDQHINLGLDEKKLLKRIERERIETFFLCDESALDRTNEFLLQAGIEAIPQLLRFLIYEASRLELTVGFYVNVSKQHMYYESTPVKIDHHLDIKETVDMVFSILLEKISSFVLVQQRVPFEACTIKRLKVNVKRQLQGQQQIPLQYRVKCDARYPNTKNTTCVDLELLSKSFRSYHGQRFGHFPASLKVNLYCLRVCASTKELYAVPYLLRSEDVNTTPTFLILTNVAGEFQGMHEIRNVRRFLKADTKDHMLECRQCKSHFADRLQFALHRQIDCGGGFMIWHINPESVELYENCFLLPKQYFKFAWFGIRN
ncbi:protein terminus [Drosophila novamexicana]|uniref:protein terminus n=1 Tax=Drosophila novamexicana TaxID=47314 RepID=UPI0011E5BC2C|nr:protein terminus [Drosophila novamexicana]